jgi:2-polyprenyl-6-methoxyphenol hydroxylase-like FAD-dependent oxidoreductase
MTVLIAGGGIGGLTLALSLHQIGVPVRVFESVAEPKALGVGINILPHAARELIELGLIDRLDTIGIRTEALAYFSKHGKPIWQEPRGLSAGYNWPQFSVHRGLLRELLSDAVIERMGGQAILTGHHLSDWEATADGVRAAFIDRQTGAVAGRYEGALLIGADGIHSAMRAKLRPGEGAPKWNCHILFRGVTMGRPFLGGRTMVMAGHEAQKLVCYPISEPGADGNQMINWVAERRFNPDYQWRRETYDRRASLAEVLPWFESWTFDWLDVPQLIRSALYIYEYPMVDRDPIERWSHGGVTLLGDAAHPMYPVGSNGASQAIVDARVLAKAILERGVTPEALAAYEAERRPATAKVVEINRRNGPDQVLQLVEERAPGGFEDVETVMPFSEREAIAAHYKTIAGFDRDALNARPPIIPEERRAREPARA